MVNAFSTPERTAVHMQKLDDNSELMTELRAVMSNPNSKMTDCVLAFTQLYHLHDGDPFAQRRLILNLEFTAKRHQQ